MIGKEGRKEGGTDGDGDSAVDDSRSLARRCVTGVTRPSVRPRPVSAVDTDFFLSFSPHFPHEEEEQGVPRGLAHCEEFLDFLLPPVMDDWGRFREVVG